MAGTATTPFPELYSFPPFFTVQPTDATRAKQLEQWAQLVVAWHAVQKKTEMTVRDWPHWENAAVGRRLPDDGVRLVMDHLVSRGNGEWMDDAHTRCRVFYRKPEEWAALVLAWAQSRHQVGEILTLFDLHSGDASRGSELYGLDPALLLRALEVLERKGNVQLDRKPDTAIDEVGVKFLR